MHVLLAYIFAVISLPPSDKSIQVIGLTIDLGLDSVGLYIIIGPRIYSLA